MPERFERPGPRTFLFADLRGYTAYVERSGDTAATHLLGTYRELVRQAITGESGVEVKTEGDSFYVVFDSSVAAVRCAAAIQQEAARQRREGLEIGIGIHAGEATPFEEQYVGSAVNIAARLAAVAAPGEILISETVRGLIRTAVPLPLDAKGSLPLKGIDEPIRAYSLRVAAPARAPAPAASHRPMDAIRRGDLDGAIQLARTPHGETTPEERCDILAALSLVAAARGQIDTGLGRSEQLLGVALRAADRSWIRAAYAWRSWLYFLARQPGEARAELDRAFERPGAGLTTWLPVLLAVSLGGAANHVERLRQMGGASSDPALGAACAIAVDVIEGRREPRAARQALEDIAGPFLGAVVEFQLSARFRREFPADVREAIARAHAERLAELIMTVAPQ